MNPQDFLKNRSQPGAPLSRSAQRALEAAQEQAAVKRKTLFGLLGLAVLLNLILAYLLHQNLVLEGNRASLQQATQEQVNEHRDLLHQRLQQQAQVAHKIANADSWLIQLDPEHPEASPENLQELRRALTEQYPDILHIRITRKDQLQLDQEAEYPLRYLELDLLKRAEQRKPTPPELTQIDQRWMLQWAFPVATGESEPVLASLLISTDASPLFDLFAQTDGALGETLLQQQFGTHPAQTIRKVGSGNAGPSLVAKIPNSYLQVQFTPSAQFKAESEQLPLLWLTIVSLSSLISLALAWLLCQLLMRRRFAAQRKGPSVQETVAASSSQSDEEKIANPLFHNQDILDIAMIDDDENILGLSETSGKKINPSKQAQRIDEASVPAEIFRSYDIRGLVDSQITPELAQLIGQAAGSEAIDQGEQSIVVARDGRTHSEVLTQALIKGILRTGCNVINIGVVPTPLMYFSTFHFDDTNSGVMVTASHNPKEYNGFKIVINNRALADEAVLDLRSRIIGQRFHQGLGEEQPREIIRDYIERIFSDVALAGNVSLVVDAGNAVPGLVAPALFEELGCDVIPLFCDLDGEFPNHDPDPTVERNLQALIAKVQESNADLGVAFDGDGDRLVVVTPKGDIIWPDRLLMLFAKDILARNPGADVLFDVKCSRQLNQVISSYGGRPIMWKTGHSPMKAKMEETQALIGGEYSGHIFIKDRWYGFDDGIYAMARLLEIITLRDQKIDAIFEAFPQLIATPEIKIEVSEKEKFQLVERLIAQGDFTQGALTTIDGLRVDYTKGWGLVRASNTSAALTLRFEAESNEALIKIQQLFKRELLKINPQLKIDF